MTKVYYLPDGTKNLGRLFPINWSNVESYYVTAQDATTAVIATTPIIKVDSCLERGVRIHFINYLGATDAINFHIVSQEHDVKSGGYQSPEAYPQDKTKHGLGRINIATTDGFTVSTIDYPEGVLDWLNELADSPTAWLEWFGIQGQTDSYLPIVISDAKVPNLKEEGRYEYEIDIDFVMSNPRKPLRG